jgi:hypothetical protein
MPVVSSFPDFMADWDRLVRAIDNHQRDLPDLAGLVAPLEELLAEARNLNAAKAASRAQLRNGGKRTRTLLPEGRAAATRLRAALVAHYGNHNEILGEFGIVPVRRRRVPERADPPPPTVPLEGPPKQE